MSFLFLLQKNIRLIVSSFTFVFTLLAIFFFAPYPAVAQTDAIPQPNRAALQKSIKLSVNETGIQEITGASLQSVGWELATLDPTKLHLSHNGDPVALQLSNLGLEGRLTTTSTIRFYTPFIGDRWNSQSIYWLTTEANDGLFMQTRSVAPSAGLTRTNAIESGIWISNTLYQSQYAGKDGDHWFHGWQNNYPFSVHTQTLTVSFASKLPVVSDSSVMTINLTLNQSCQSIVLQADTETTSWTLPFTATMSGSSDQASLIEWSPVITATEPITQLRLSYVQSGSDCSALLDNIVWEQTVALDLQKRGAFFTGVAGNWQYKVQNSPPDTTLYDVTNQREPQILTGIVASSFEDGPSPHHYLWAGTGYLHTPQLVAHPPISLGARSNQADAIYIASAEFHAALQPLVELRRTQGYQVIVADVQEVYDGWSYGYISPDGIRDFLRYAHTEWQTPTLRSVVLVGDGTYDPKNYEQKNNQTFIPPYLANVDPWLGENACETCYAQLDGGNPLISEPGNQFKTDVWLGRFPVNSESDVISVTNKLIAYETDPDVNAAWRNKAIFLADNYVKHLQDGRPIADPAGDFAKDSDFFITMLPSSLTPIRIYYDPYPQISDPLGREPWRIPDPTAVQQTITETINAGAGLLTFHGHGNHFSWGYMESDTSFSHLNMFTLNQPYELTNQNRYFISLSMNCLSSRFSIPARSRTTLDEQMLLAGQGGAVATWGSSGLILASAHEALQQGFHKALREGEPMHTPIGALIDAGYAELRSRQQNRGDATHILLLLGDPLMLVRIGSSRSVYLPVIQR